VNTLYISLYRQLNKTTEEESLSDCKHYRLPAQDAVQLGKKITDLFLGNYNFGASFNTTSYKKTLYCDTEEYTGQ
jgi:hypothetical protein